MSVSLHWPQSTVKFVFRGNFSNYVIGPNNNKKKNVDSQKEKQGALLWHWRPSLEIRRNMTSVTPIIVVAYCIQL